MAVELGVSLIQIREKQLTGKLLYKLVCDAVTVTAGTETLLLVNDRADIAVAAGADGVHLPAMSLSPKMVRAAFGPEIIIGVSTHSISEASNARVGGADYIVFGPVFATPGKGDGCGVKGLAEVCRELVSFPVIALGGIDSDNFRSSLDAGAAGFAAIRSLNDPTEMTRTMSIIRKMR